MSAAFVPVLCRVLRYGPVEWHWQVIDTLANIVIAKETLNPHHALPCEGWVIDVQVVKKVVALAERLLDLSVEKQLDVVNSPGRALTQDAVAKRFPV